MLRGTEILQVCVWRGLLSFCAAGKERKLDQAEAAEILG